MRHIRETEVTLLAAEYHTGMRDFRLVLTAVRFCPDFEQVAREYRCCIPILFTTAKTFIYFYKNLFTPQMVPWDLVSFGGHKRSGDSFNNSRISVICCYFLHMYFTMFFSHSRHRVLLFPGASFCFIYLLLSMGVLAFVYACMCAYASLYILLKYL